MDGSVSPPVTLPQAELDRITDDLVAQFKTVFDPEIPVDIYELGLIYKVDINDERFVDIEMTLTAPGCPVAGEMPAWIEPIGDWGTGAVVLVEIPAETETNDNIVAYWRPSDPIPAGRPYALTYRLTWCETPPVDPAPARVVASRGGLSFDRKRRLFVVDFDGLSRDDPAPTVDVSATRGTIGNVAARWNPPSGGYRVSFELDTGRETLIELRLVLVRDAAPVSETWLYRWTPA